MEECIASRLAEPDEKDALMRAGPEMAHVGEIKILRDEESSVFLRSLPNIRIGPACEVF